MEEGIAQVTRQALPLICFGHGGGVAVGVVARDAVKLLTALDVASAPGKRRGLEANRGLEQRRELGLGLARIMALAAKL